MAGEAAYGIKLKMGSPAVEIAGVRDINGPGYTAETMDVTARDSASLPFREIIPGLLSAGEVTFDCLFDPDGATHKAADGGLLYAFKQRVEEDFEMEYPDGTKDAFKAYVTGFQPKAPFEGELAADVTLTINGDVTTTYV